MDAVDLHSHLLHDFHTVLEGEDYTLLRCADKVSAAVTVEVDAMETATRGSVSEHAFSTVSKGKDADSAAADRRFLGEGVHAGVAHAVEGDVAPYPGIENARAVDAEQHSQAWIRRSMIDMRESVHPGLGVVVHLAEHSVDHPGSACGGSDFTGIQHIQAKRVVRLVPCPVGDGRAGLEPEFCGSRGT